VAGEATSCAPVYTSPYTVPEPVIFFQVSVQDKRQGARVALPARGRELWGLFFVCCLYSVDVKNLRRELI
jgi:hypothetical protein